MLKAGFIAVLLLGWLHLACASAAPADCYEYTAHPPPNFRDVNKEPVCGALLKELNAHCDEAPFRCELPAFARNSGLSLPPWKDVSPIENRERLKRLELGQKRAFLFPTEPNRVDAWRADTFGELDRLIDSGSLRLQIADMDVTNGGYRTKVYRISRNPCAVELPAIAGKSANGATEKPVVGYVRPTLLLSEAEPLATDETWKTAVAEHRRPVGSMIPIIGDALLFNGRTFVSVLDSMSGAIVINDLRPADDAPARMFAPEVCLFSFKGSRRSASKGKVQ